MFRFGEVQARGFLVLTSTSVPDGQMLPRPFDGSAAATDDNQVGVVIEGATPSQAESLLGHLEAQARESLREADAYDEHDD